MFIREKRFNRFENIKKHQRSRSRSPKHQKIHKKFLRTEDKKTEEVKKFKRHHEKPEQMTEEAKLLQAKLIRKLREEPMANQFSRIPERMGR